MSEYDDFDKAVANHWSLPLLDSPHALVSVIETKIARAALSERRRIVALLQQEASEWLSHYGVCDCKVRGEEDLRLIELIERENYA